MSDSTIDIIFGTAAWMVLLWLVGRQRIREVLDDFADTLRKPRIARTIEELDRLAKLPCAPNPPWLVK